MEPITSFNLFQRVFKLHITYARACNNGHYIIHFIASPQNEDLIETFYESVKSHFIERTQLVNKARDSVINDCETVKQLYIPVLGITIKIMHGLLKYFTW